MGKKGSKMPILPVEIYKYILSISTPATLHSCRLVNKTLCSLATPLVFRHIYLEASGDASQFANIAKSQSLRFHVREISIDTWVGPEFLYHTNTSFEPPADFFRAMPLLRVFSGLKRLNLKFNEHCGEHRDIWDCDIEEDHDFRYWVLWTVFSCLAGEWDASRSQDIYEDMETSLYENGEMIDGEDFFESLEAEMEHWQQPSPIEIEVLAIGNLADYNDSRLTDSELFKKVLYAPSLTELKLYVVFEDCEEAPEKFIHYPDKYDFMDALDTTWLAPQVAKKLRVLSLFCEDYWGWNPKMDFRNINSDNGPDSAFPKLEVLALGNYVFSHEWQKDWFASLGRHNFHGGLRELYLDNCPIIYAANMNSPLDEGPDGAYPFSSIMIDGTVSEKIERLFPMRWHHLLNYWAENMAGLKVFKMGSGDWRGSAISNWISDFYIDVTQEFNYERVEQRFCRTNFMTYDCVSPSELSVDVDNFRVSTHGIGIKEERSVVLEYIQFHTGFLPTHWLQENEEGVELERPEDLDDEALHRIKEMTGGV